MVSNVDAKLNMLNIKIAACRELKKIERDLNNSVIPKEVYDRLSPNRQYVVDTLDTIDDEWAKQALTAVDDAFFEKAARIIHPHSHRLARKMLEG